MIITNAKYKKDVITDIQSETTLTATINGVEMFVPINTANRHYKEILKQVADGDITIAEAD